MFRKLDHVEIVPVNINKTIDFYVSILGFELKQRFAVPQLPMKEIAYLELGGSVIELISVQDPDLLPQSTWKTGYRAIAIEVENMEDAVNYLKSKDVAITWGPVSIGKAKRAEIQDPDVLQIELRQW